MSAVLCSALLASSAAWAVDLPRFDAKLRCASMSDLRAVASCEHSENAARYAILAKWGNYPLQRRHFCVQAETIRPREQRSYVTLSQCLGEPNATS